MTYYRVCQHWAIFGETNGVTAAEIMHTAEGDYFRRYVGPYVDVYRLPNRFTFEPTIMALTRAADMVNSGRARRV